jgi:hypothetical protein
LFLALLLADDLRQRDTATDQNDGSDYTLRF